MSTDVSGEGWVVRGIYDDDSYITVHVGCPDEAVYKIRKDDAAIESAQPRSEDATLNSTELTASLDGALGSFAVAPKTGYIVATVDNMYGEDRGSTMPLFYLAIFHHSRAEEPVIVEGSYSMFNLWVAPNGQKALVNYGKIYVDIAVLDLVHGTLTPIVRPVTAENYDYYPMPILVAGNLSGPVMREAAAAPNEDERIHFCSPLGVTKQSVKSSEIDIRTQQGRERLVEIVKSMHS